MARAAIRFTPGLLDVVREGAKGSRSIADVWRLVGDEAERLGSARPRYERVRILVHEYRRLTAGPTTAEILLDVAFRVRPPDALVDRVTGGAAEL